MVYDYPSPPREKYAGLRPTCTECKSEIMDDYWIELQCGTIVVCPDCIAKNRHYIEELEV